jgi:hypothetical protein
MDQTGSFPLMDDQGQPVMHPAGIPLLHPQTRVPLMMDNRPVLMYPMLDPNGLPYRDEKQKIVFEMPIIDEQGYPVMFHNRPLFKHPLFTDQGQTLIDEQGAPMFYPAGIPLLSA